MSLSIDGELRQIHPQWNHGLITASLAISLLGAFTATQLMCQARTSKHFSGVLVWTVLSSLTFGFCSIWTLHAVAMLAFEMDIPIGLNLPLTILSAVLAVVFTFTALGCDLLWTAHRRGQRKKRPNWLKHNSRGGLRNRKRSTVSGVLHSTEDEDEDTQYMAQVDPSFRTSFPIVASAATSPLPNSKPATPDTPPQWPTLSIQQSDLVSSPADEQSVQQLKRTPTGFGDDPESETASFGGTLSEDGSSQRSSSFTDSTVSGFRFGKFHSMKSRRQSIYTQQNPFLLIMEILLSGLTIRNIARGFSWSLAISSMHFVGIWGLQIPNGFVVLNPALGLLAATISWILCTVGCVLMAEMETALGLQLLFSLAAATGVAAMHFTGMAAVTFYTTQAPSAERGYPQALASSIIAIAITTCIAANGLLAHSATVSRDKLAEVFQTRKRMWMVIAQKENAEAAAAARSDFIASASHEIRTPLHQLQGYSDLLSRTELTDEGRLLLYAIQHATKTLSLITTNVLDWSRLEKNGEKACQLVSLDMRKVCEAIMNLLPNKDEDNDAEILVVVAPDVPHSLFLDETFIHRVLMNLLSNATKFTPSGYILMLIEMKSGNLVATVKDTGYGIPPSFMPKLFDAFTQAETLGTHRGTGLGLSIIKQLLKKMDGKIEVNSKYGAIVGQDFCGSDFVATIPASSSTESLPIPNNISRIAAFHDKNERYLEGLRLAWAKFGTEIILVKDIADLTREKIKYVWLDVAFLQRNPDIHAQLNHRQDLLILVTYDTQMALDYAFKMLSIPRHYITVRKPLIIHSILQSLALVEAGQSRSSPEKSVRFAPHIHLMDDKENLAPGQVPFTVLLVEDNKINLKLMQKMLTALKYLVLVAKDGQEAIDQTLAHDGAIDVILMDQSMPNKDGLTATREIRELERDGTLSKRHLIVAVTAVVSSESQNLSEAAGTDDFLAKPVSLMKLGDCLEKWLKSKV